MRQMDETKSVTNSEEVEYQVCPLHRGAKRHIQLKTKKYLPYATDLHSMENEKRVAFDNINLAPFRKKWAPFKHCPSEKLLKKQTST